MALIYLTYKGDSVMAQSMEFTGNMMGSYTESYLIHNSLILKVISLSPELLNYSKRFLRRISKQAGSLNKPGLPEVELTLVNGVCRRPQEYENKNTILKEERDGEIVNRIYDDRFTVRYGQDVYVEYFPSTRKAYAEYSGDVILYRLPFMCINSVLHWAFKELGFFPLHAAAVSYAGMGLLMVAPSGVGKSTTAVLLTKEGFSFLHDDGIWIRSRGSYLELFSLPGPIRLNQDTLESLGIGEHLAVEVYRESENPASKYAFFVEETPSFRSTQSARCSIICFLGRNGIESSFQSISSNEALERLTSQSFLMSAPFVTKEYLKILVHLSEKVPQFLVTLGTDFKSIPYVFHQVIQSYVADKDAKDK